MKFDPFIYGKDQTAGVVSVEIENDHATILRSNGLFRQTMLEYYILYADKYNSDCIRLEGDLHYKWAEKFSTRKEYQAAIGKAKALGLDYYTIYNPKEAFMVKTGVTYYKGMKPKDVSVLSFDIETTGLSPESNQVLMISNTYRNGETIERRLFSIDDFKSEKEMIYAWCSYVVDSNPSILLGHNIFGFDLPFIRKRLGQELPIGRMRRPAKTARYVSQFRKDGSQSYDYTNVLVPGREVVDTFHLAIKYDVGRNYPSYGLKQIIEYEGLERDDRQHFDASTIGDLWRELKQADDMMNNPSPLRFFNAVEEWEKIKKYAEHDADDSLALFDLMIPSYFYYAQHIPKTMQQIVNSATGSQINSFMVRAYLAEGHSIPKASESERYEGGISFGYPGIYENVGKVDVASLYPSIILQHKIYDKEKDPKGLFLKMVDYFTKERLENKRLANETKDRHYRDLEQSEKIFVNSAYGFMGAPGLNFNSPDNAALVTKHGRDILKKGIHWAEMLGHQIVNADTDSFSIANIEVERMSSFIERLNAQYEDGIVWEDDGHYSKVAVVKAKNYVLKDSRSGNVKIKGSALKATMKEPALKEFIDEVIECLLEGREDVISDIYMDYARLCCSVDVDSIAKWCSKKTITKAVLQPKRTNEQRILDAIKKAGKPVQEGDKIWVYFKSDTEIGLQETFDGEYDQKRLLKKLYKTAEIFESILSMDKFPNLSLKKNQGLLKELTAQE